MRKKSNAVKKILFISLIIPAVTKLVSKQHVVFQKTEVRSLVKDYVVQ